MNEPNTPEIKEVIDKACKEAGVDPNNHAFRAKLFERLWLAGHIKPNPNQ